MTKINLIELKKAFEKAATFGSSRFGRKAWINPSKEPLASVSEYTDSDTGETYHFITAVHA